MSKLLPRNFDARVKDAVRHFWLGRADVSTVSQEGGRGSVIGGKNLDGFAQLILEVALFCGVDPESIVVTGKSRLTIPGFFRSTKMWDSLVVYNGRLIAAFELKSQVGPSFGNNFNNRTEESIGSATDFWTAHRERAFEPIRNIQDAPQIVSTDGAKPPFLGYLMLLEECPRSISPVQVDESHFKVFPEFVDSSYAKRYELLLDRLVSEKLYSAASLILSNRLDGNRSGAHHSPKDSLSPRSLFAEFAGKLLAAMEIS